MGGMVMRIYPCMAAGYFILFLMYAAILFLYYYNDLTGAVLTTLGFCGVTFLGSVFPPITASEYALYLSWKCISTRATKITVAEILVNMAIPVGDHFYPLAGPAVYSGMGSYDQHFVRPYGRVRIAAYIRNKMKYPAAIQG